VVITITSAGLRDGTISANASIIATALMAHPLAQLLGTATIQALVAISERRPPTATAEERQFLRDAIKVVEQAEIVAGREVAA
jgi:hypothetical protein